MSLKNKLITAISMFALVFCVLVVGVWALKSTNFTVGGNINFTAKGVQATISKGVLSDTGSFDPSVTGDKMPQVKINTSHTQDQIDTMFEDWQGLHLLFNENGDDVTITFSITNDASYTDKLLAVTVTPTTGTLNNATLSINKSSAQIASGKSQEFVITFKVTEKTMNASVPSFSINFNLELADMVVTDESEVSYLTFSYDHNNLTASVTNCASGTAIAEVPERVRHTYTNDGGQQVTAVYEVTSIVGATSSSTGAFYATRSTLESVTLPSTLKIIGSYAFYGCSNLTSITIPDSVETLGEYAFDGCSKLTFATYENANYLGNKDNPYVVLYKATSTSITSCIINDRCKVICSSAFKGCSITTFSATANNANYLGNKDNPYVVLHSATSTSITSCTINSNCKVICSFAFKGCSSLTSVSIPASVTSIGDSAFSDCSILESITIGSGVTNIGYYAFQYCSSLESITIGSGVTSIGYRVFSDCSSLTTIEVDDNNVTYNDGNGSNCIIEKSSNTLVVGCKGTVIPNSVISIGKEAFYNCSSLTSINIPYSVETIGSYAFYQCKGLASITIPANVEEIGDFTFQGCIDLETVTLGNNLKSIGQFAFNSCKSLTSINIPNSVKSIGFNAFSESGLINVAIGSGILDISDEAFYNCGDLVKVTINNSTPPALGYDVFYDVAETFEIYVPNSSYKYEENWSDYIDYFVVA